MNYITEFYRTKELLIYQILEGWRKMKDDTCVYTMVNFYSDSKIHMFDLSQSMKVLFFVFCVYSKQQKLHLMATTLFWLSTEMRPSSSCIFIACGLEYSAYFKSFIVMKSRILSPVNTIPLYHLFYLTFLMILKS